MASIYAKLISQLNFKYHLCCLVEFQKTGRSENHTKRELFLSSNNVESLIEKDHMSICVQSKIEIKIMSQERKNADGISKKEFQCQVGFMKLKD